MMHLYQPGRSSEEGSSHVVYIVELTAGRSSASGIGILNVNRGHFRFCANLIMGVNDIRKIIGDIVSP